MPDIVISEFMDGEAVRRGLKDFDVLYDPHLADRKDDLTRACADARALIVRNRTPVDRSLLDAAPRLQVVGRLGVGLDNIDTQACQDRAVAVYPATGANDVSVAEYVVTAAMLLMRGIFFSTDRVIAGAWPRNDLIGREIFGKQLGLVGFGAIARETAKRATALGMAVAAHDPYVPAESPAWDQPWGRVEPLSLDTLLAASDIVSLHVPMTPQTCHLIDGSRLSLMKKDAILINAARGGVLDEPALAEALKSGRLGGAALDVFLDEPLAAARAGIFSGCPNLVLTPHVAGVTQESNLRVSWATVENVRRHLAKI